MHLKLPTLTEGSQICSSSRSQLIDKPEISSSSNSGNIAQVSGRDQLDTEDHEIISADEDQIYNKEIDSYFLDTKMQCKNKYQEVGVDVLNEIIEKCNASKNGQETSSIEFNI